MNQQLPTPAEDAASSASAADISADSERTESATPVFDATVRDLGHDPADLPPGQNAPFTNTTTVNDSTCGSAFVPLTTVDEVHRALLPERDDVVAHHAEALAAARPDGIVDSEVRRGRAWQQLFGTLNEFAEVIDTAVSNVDTAVLGLRRDDDTVPTLFAALQDEHLRLRYLVRARQIPLAAQHLMITLAQVLPAPERAVPATVLATQLGQMGQAALAHAALDVAEEADPSYLPARLLRSLLIGCADPAGHERAAHAARISRGFPGRP
jgi:hypothetical protein